MTPIKVHITKSGASDGLAEQPENRVLMVITATLPLSKTIPPFATHLIIDVICTSA